MVTRWHPKKDFFETPSNETCTANGLTFTANDRKPFIPTNKNARNDSSVREWFANICLALGNKKTFGLWAWRNHSSYVLQQKTSRHRIEALVRQKGSCCCCVAVVVLVVCCCCFLWLSFLLLLLQFFSLVITCPVTLLDYNSYHSKLRAKISRPWWYWSTNTGFRIKTCIVAIGQKIP